MTKKTPAGSKQEPENILGRAMLANVNISLWQGRKYDRKVTDKVNEEYAAGRQAGRYNKHLFGGPIPELSALVTAGQYLRMTHYAQTLPWSDAGWRLLPTANYMNYCELMRGLVAKFEIAREAFLKVYVARAREAETKLGKMYKSSDYPSPNSLRRKFSVALDFTPIPSGDDFRVTLPKEEMNRVAQEVEDRVEKAVADAMQDAWARLGEAVQELKERLADEAKGLRGNVLVKLGDIAQVLGRLNLTQDPALEATRKQVLTQLATLDAEQIRENKETRTQAATAVEDILRQVKAVYTPIKEDE